MMVRRISRRTALRGALAGLLIVGPLFRAAFDEVTALGYAPCDKVTCKLKHAYCNGTNWTQEYDCTDFYNPNLLCWESTTIWPNHPNCTDTETIVGSNALYVCEHEDYTGNNYAMLCAQSSTIGAPQRWSLVPTDPYTNIWSLQSANTGKFVTVETGFTGSNYAMLRATKTTVSQQEQFNLADLGGGKFGLYSIANGLYVAAELSYTGALYGMLRARSSSIGGQETLTIDASLTEMRTTLPPGALLDINANLLSSNGEFSLIMQGDGNLVMYVGSTAVWNSGTQNHPGAYALMQSDGNFVIYAQGGRTALWSTHTQNHPGAYALMQSDGNFVIYAQGGQPALWSTGTH